MDDYAHERERSLKFVQIVFAVLALISLFASLMVVTRGDELGLPETSIETIAFAFLVIGAVDTALLFLWERIYQRLAP